MMKKSAYLGLLILLMPCALLAQDTAVVKRQANAMAQAMVNGNYAAIVARTYPVLVQMAGGKEKMLQLTIQTMNDLKAQGFTFESLVIGAPGKFYKAGTQIHCLIPEKIRMKIPQGHASNSGYLLAVSSDGAKIWTFVDVNANTKQIIPKLFPHFNQDLKIPELGEPVIEQ